MQNIYKNYKDWKLKRHVEKFGSKNNGYFNYFNRAWFEEHQETLIWLLNHWLLKYWFRWILRIHKDCKFSEYIDEIRPNTYRILLDNNTYRSDFRTHQKFSKRIYYAFCPVWWAIHLLDWTIQKTVAPEFSFGFDTLTVYPDADPETTTVDGSVTKDANTWADARSASSGSDAYPSVASTDVGAAIYVSGDAYYSVRRGFWLFNTSSLGSVATISSASISLYGQAKTSSDSGLANSYIVSSTPASNTNLVLADYSLIGSTSFASKLYADFLTTAYNDYTLDSNGINNINKTSISKFGSRSSGDLNNNAPTSYNYVSAYTAETTGTSQDPKLVVTYSLPTAISAIFGIPIADIKTINGIAGASVKSIMGLTYVQPAPIVPWYGERGVFGGGYTGGYINIIEYITIVTTGNSTDFGDLTLSRGYLANCSSGTRGIFGGGFTGASPWEINVIDYITIATTGNSIDFGDLIGAKMYYLASFSSATRGIFGGGTSALTGIDSNIIDYITIATTANSIDFGDLSDLRYGMAGCSNGNRGIFAGGYHTGYKNIIEYITIVTTGNSTDFGDLSVGAYGNSGCSNLTKGVIAIGYKAGIDNIIEYITISTLSNTSDFGDLTVSRYYTGSSSNGNRGVFGSGEYSGGLSNVIDYITIASIGNATDFGDLTATRHGVGGCSGN